MIWQRLYNTQSGIEGGTLYQLRNLINRRNVTATVHGRVNEVEDFLEVVISCYLVTSAMHYFGMENVNDVPHLNAFQNTISSLPLLQRKQQLLARLNKIIDIYVIPEQYQMSHVLSPPGTSTNTVPPSTLHADHLFREHSFGPVAPQRQIPVSLRQYSDRLRPTIAVQRKVADGVFDYSSAILNDGLLLLELKDAIREGDGERVLRCWKAMLLYYHTAGHKNYAKEAIYLQATRTVNAAATPKVAAQIMYSRFINSSGKKGHNIPIDLHNEHLIRTLKNCVAATGANLTSQMILQCGQSLKGIMEVCQKFDTEHNLHQLSSEHSKGTLDRDRQLILEELKKSRVFDYIPGRSHSTFKTIKPCISMKVNSLDLIETIKRHKKHLAKTCAVASCFNHAF